MMVSKDGEGMNALPTISSPIHEVPTSLVDLNDTTSFSPLSEHETNISSEDRMFPPCVDSSCELENFPKQVHFVTAKSDNLVSKDNEPEVTMLSIKQYGRAILDYLVKSLDQARVLNNGLKNLFSTLSEEYKTQFINTISPSKVTTKRQHSFLSPFKRKKRCSHDSHTINDAP